MVMGFRGSAPALPAWRAVGRSGARGRSNLRLPKSLGRGPALGGLVVGTLVLPLALASALGVGVFGLRLGRRASWLGHGAARRTGLAARGATTTRRERTLGVEVGFHRGTCQGHGLGRSRSGSARGGCQWVEAALDPTAPKIGILGPGVGWGRGTAAGITALGPLASVTAGAGVWAGGAALSRTGVTRGTLQN